MNECKFCKHKWRSRTEAEPKSCPLCKRYLWKEEKSKKETKK